ncbi:LAETG motif-containing sortase-dependent surface protein [Streptomyces sp. NPDC058045]|uniref:LAETG motif-containing sortase-dependent surface protein n=1 Tax=Streptomyces sp. NPDC058045 TaxID=3346311 RepID=UPI0036E4BE28
MRLAAATLVSGLAVAGSIAGAGSAAADDAPQQHGGATATINGLKTAGPAVIHAEEGDQRVSAGLFEMTVKDGGTLQTYCIDIHNPTKPDASYQETPWSGTSLAGNADAGKIRWILQNSYPQVNDLAQLAKNAGVPGLTDKDAAAGTQVAIWRYSDHAKVDALGENAEKLADYLERSAQNAAEPKASLSLEPNAVSGHAGEKLGPVTVHTNARQVTVTPPAEAAAGGVKIVDKTGKPVTSAADGSEIYFDVPEDAQNGSAALSVQASTTVPVGRAFASESRSQTQILAGSSQSTVSAQATATWADRGPIPAVSAEKNCAKGGLDITVANKGDQPFGFDLKGVKHTIAAGKSQTVTIPLKEDQAYDFKITGPNGFEKRFQGVLDCKTQSGGGTGGETPAPSSQPSAASAGGTGGGDLAATGSSSATPVIAGIAVALLVVGGGAVFLVRKKKAPAQH